ncbi:MAG: Beta-galactosidase C-terminal domain [Halanaerobiaceae bacterium]
MIEKLELKQALEIDLPQGVTAQLRTEGQNRYLFIMNFNEQAVELELEQKYRSLISDTEIEGNLNLEGYGVEVITASF